MIQSDPQLFPLDGPVQYGCTRDRKSAVVNFLPEGQVEVQFSGEALFRGTHAELQDVIRAGIERCGRYYTPKEVIDVIDPAAGSGAFVVDGGIATSLE